MKNIIAFAGSNSKNSINKKLSTYASSMLNNVKVRILDLNNFDLPLYGVDYEREHGIPEKAHKFLELIKSSDGIILSLAEHNGSYTVAFKNIFDWMSRIDQQVFQSKPMLLMATSPGGRGGQTVLLSAKGSFPHMGGNIVADFSLPFFGTNFLEDKITNSLLDDQLKKMVLKFKTAIN